MTEVMENLPTMQETWIQSPGGGNSNSLQYSFLGNPMDRGTWLSTHVHACTHMHTHVWRYCFDSLILQALIVLYFRLRSKMKTPVVKTR